jgi:single-strand DNA-binding protein
MINPSNQVSIIGNVGAAPVERAKTRDGKGVVGFAVAQSLTRIDAATGQPAHQGAQWFQVTCFAGLAEKVRSQLTKGELVMVVGELKSASYTSKSGEPRTSIEITASEVLRVARLRRPGLDASAFDDWNEAQDGL